MRFDEMMQKLKKLQDETSLPENKSTLAKMIKDLNEGKSKSVQEKLAKLKSEKDAW